MWCLLGASGDLEAGAGKDRETSLQSCGCWEHEGLSSVSPGPGMASDAHPSLRKTAPE